MRIDVRSDGCFVVTAPGTFTDPNQHSLDALEEQLRVSTLVRKPIVVIVDMSRVERINPRGLGALVAMLAMTVSAGGTFALAGTDSPATDYLQQMRLDYVFRYWRSVDQAVESLTSSWQSTAPSP